MEEVTDNTVSIVKLLLSDITNFDKVNKRNKSVIQLAKESQNQEILELMEDILERNKINATKRELKKLQANQIINKRKKNSWNLVPCKMKYLICNKTLTM